MPRSGQRQTLFGATAPRANPITEEKRCQRRPNGRRPNDGLSGATIEQPQTHRVVKKEFEALSDVEYADIRAGMDEVSIVGMSAARHVRGDIYEVRADSETGVAIRVLFAEEGQRRKILLSLAAFKKKRQKTPENEIKKAQQRLADWRSGRKPAVPTKPRHTKPRR